MKRPAILVIRSDDKFSSHLRGAGFEVVNLELIRTRPIDDLSALRSKLATLAEYDGVFFTSPIAAEIFVHERNRQNGFHGSVYALGRRAKIILEAAGFNVKTSEAANTAEELLNAFEPLEFAGKRFLFVRGERSMRTVPEKLGGKATVDEVVVYSTEKSEVDERAFAGVKDLLSKNEIAWVCFFSPFGVERFREIFGDEANSLRAAAIGTTTANAAKRLGVMVEYLSPESSSEAFAQGLIDHIKNIE
jgi:uroporphyrinogen-III synthase